MPQDDRERLLEAALVKTEQRLSRIGELELELRQVTTRCHNELVQARAERDEARWQLERVRRVQADLEASVSWRLTAPLRRLKRA